jgi:hypothetical protein
MSRRVSSTKAIPIAVAIAFLLVASAPIAWADPPAAALAAFNTYVTKIEARLAEQHGSGKTFLVNVDPGSQTDARLRRGEVIIEQLTPASESDLPGALLHHWRGTAFVPGATAAGFEHLMKDFSVYPQVYSPQVVRAAILSPHADGSPDHLVAMMRVRQKHVITVVMDTTYNISYGRLDPEHGYSISRSTSISEIADAGTAKEHALKPKDDHGFLWRLNTYWSYEERDGGLYIQVESISLTRGIPAGLGWVIRPYIESVPRESLEFTLRATCKALQNSQSLARK